MDPLPGHQSQSYGRQLIIKADEVDQGTAIHSPSKQLPLSALIQNDTSSLNLGGVKAGPTGRPVLRREGSVPAPPLQPPPPAPLQLSMPDSPSDSLSLPQLKQLVSQFPKIEQRAYAFQFDDAQSFVEEVDEWFQYSEQDRLMMLNSRESFEQQWRHFCRERSPEIDGELSWLDADSPLQEAFLKALLSEIHDVDALLRTELLGCFLYVLCGAWGVTAGLEQQRTQSDVSVEGDEGRFFHSVQIESMHRAVDMFLACLGLNDLFDCTKRYFRDDPRSSASATALAGEDTGDTVQEISLRELDILLTLWYILVESARVRAASYGGGVIRSALYDLNPNFLVFLVEILARLRWDEDANIPLTRLLQLFWKALLLLFGDTKHDLEHVKRVLQPKVDAFSPEASHPVLTASPLDYHLFRQEITSKYPAYNPPLPLVPLELEHKSILPPLPNHSSRMGTASGAVSGYGSIDFNASGSILHQPVHIATPAPSPPPSPAGPGGKAGKKQNYQTNQNFPFLYPPLDDTSNNIGGKGTTELQDHMAGKKWEGSDIPASIIEAGELFASRMRMTRAMRQLWKERELFLKYERGWEASELPPASNNLDSDNENLDMKLGREKDERLNEQIVQDRLSIVETFYHHAMPNLQSLVIVMMKVMLKNVQEIATQNGSLPENHQTNGLPRTKSNVNVQQATGIPAPPPPPQSADLSIEELNSVRSREISHKAISGAIFLLLKWFKVSHVLKFEYFTQLLLDSNYVPLSLKYFAHQNLDELVAIRYDRDDLSFFHFCHINSDHPPLSPTSPQPDSDASSNDEAVPPPILRHRRSPTSNSDGAPGNVSSQGQMDGQEEPHPLQIPRPSVDELGNPLAPLPSTPITTFSFRQFQTSIHLLRILQKITRSKAHRILLLVQYKSSQILRRILRVPDPMLRLYVLKLFKSQVPYCGRKWRQSNMRVITAIYLHCRPELRDEWLAGMHDSSVEGEVDEAVPLEWALRGLTYWWQKRMYGDVMRVGSGAVEMQEGGGQKIEDDERDFFQKELDNMGWGMAGLAVGEDVAFGEEAAGVNGHAVEQWEQGGPLNIEGW